MKDTPPREYNGEKVFTKVDQMPSFPGGDAALLQYIARSIKYPVESQRAGNQGRVIASFTVDKEGNIAQLELVRGIEPLLDAASTSAWYLFADPNAIDTVEVTFLQGQETPQMRQETSIENLSIAYYILQSVGAKALDYRGLQKHNNA